MRKQIRSRVARPALGTAIRTWGATAPPTGARRRSPTQRQAALRASQASTFVRGCSARTRRAALVASRRDRWGPQAELAFRAEAGRRGGGISARLPAVARPGSLLRGRRDDDDDRAGRDSRASWGLREPSGGCDDPGRTV